ncbi:MAG: CBS domain-containing protein [Nanoarchaeota archaeon]|nr:CBS domain-containing protein [Nanoarchaeota archaeon]
MKNVLVADIMTRSPVTIKPDTNLMECARTMVKKRVGSLLIIDKKDKKKLRGFLDQKDILWALIKKSKEDLSKIKAIDISSRKIATIKPSATINATIDKMKKLKFEKFPVIHNGELVGIITIRDILNFHPEFYPELEEFAKIKEETNKLKRLKLAKKREVIEGVCEECGEYNTLYRENGILICDSCRSKI